MDIQELHNKLSKQCSNHYRINEILPFAYPYRRLIIDVTVNKNPDKAIQQVYSVFLRTILSGYNKDEDIINFLGLQKEDFILRELYFLREKGYLDIVSGIWYVTESGKEFIKDNNILRILEEEQFEFLIDSNTNEVLPKDFRLSHDDKIKNKIESNIEYSIKDPEILSDKNEQLLDVYKSINEKKAYLVDYDKSNIKFDREEYHDYYLIEYIPIKSKEHELEAYIEIRNIDNMFSLNKRLTKIMSELYPKILYQFSNSERTVIAKLENENNSLQNEFVSNSNLIETVHENEYLSIWQTQNKFAEALKKVQNRILIESPWIKKATLEYIPFIDNILKEKKEVIILYGIEGNDEHDFKTIEKLKELSSKYQNFKLVHLPSHFEKKRMHNLAGTHRKLLIKDNEYFIQGSFNFLSFNKKEGQKVANEESILIRKDVNNKWKQVYIDYKL